LTFNQCANCPLDAADHPHCPAALQMASAVELLKSALASFDTVGVTVYAGGAARYTPKPPRNWR